MKDDTISRQALLDTVDLLNWYHQNKNGEMVHGANSDEHQAWYKAEDIYKAIESVPSAQPTDRNGQERTGTDLISRQAALDTLDVLCQEHRYRIPGKRETYSQYNEAWQDALGRAEGAIGNLPPAQPGWIPCTPETMPKNKSNVLTVIYIPGRQAHIRSGWYEDGLFMNDNGDTWKATDKEVVGWMYQPKLPKPWEGDANG